MKIAVVIPVYNGEDWIRQTLESVLAQTKAPANVFVVDDGSEDGSTSIVRDYPEVQLLSSPGSGPNAARNHGWQEAVDADAVAFLDCDDLWHPDHLKRLGTLLQHHEDCGAVFSQIAPFAATATPTYQTDPTSFRTYDPWIDDYPVNRLGQPVGALIRRSALEATGGWSTRHDGCADYYLWIRLALEGPLLWADWKTAAYRVHPVSYNHGLRATKTELYLTRRYDASREVLEERRRKGMDAETYEPRLAALAALLDLFRAMRDDLPHDRTRALEQFDDALHHQPEPLITGLWQLFGWYTAPYFGKQDGQAFVQRTFQLLEHWPSSSRRTHPVIDRWACRQSSPRDLIAQGVWRTQSWSYVLKEATASTLRSARKKVALRSRLKALTRNRA